MILKGTKQLLVLILAGSMLLACNDSQQTEKVAKEDWVQEEILQQLSELRREMKTLRDEFTALQQQLAGVGSAPTPGRVSSVKLDSEIAMGDPKADFAIVEFTDYQCPYCARHYDAVLPAIKEKLVATGKAKYLIYDFPLSFHAQAKNAAIAARCAGRQGKYWEMHDVLFANQARLGVGLYVGAARDLLLDEKDFSRCLNDPAVGRAVDDDFAYGNQVNVTGTPKFFVGKVDEEVLTDVIVIDGAQGYAAFADAIARLE